MHDLNGFLSDNFQYALKAEACTNSNGRFEFALRNYFKLFFDKFGETSSAHTLDSLRNIKSTTKPSLYDWIDCVGSGLQKDIDLFKELFEDIIHTYQLFIEGKRYQATLHIFRVLEKYEMTDIMEPSELGLYYKGRIIKEGDVTSDVDYYYHIPFDQRYRIANQRFSYSGEPILYLGSSILDVLYELRCDPNEYSKIAIASIGYNPLMEKSTDSNTGEGFRPLRIYDVTNHIHKLINEVLSNLMRQEVKIPRCDDKAYGPNITHLKKDFKKFILTQICTFKRTRGSTFIEEYVPAQILTEALRINGYNGVKFPSTQFDSKNIVNHSILYPSAIQENLALFTNYHASNKYDLHIMNYFFVNPLDVSTAFAKSNSAYREDIKRLQSDTLVEAYQKTHMLRNFLSEALMNIGKVHSCESDIEIGGKRYFDWDFASLELLAQCKYLSEVQSHLNSFTMTD